MCLAAAYSHVDKFEELMIRKRIRGENRSDEQLREHYEIELELAQQLRNSTRAERLTDGLYRSLYDTLFRRVPHHQQLTRKESEAEINKTIRWQLGLIKRFVTDKTIFLEVGPGDCVFASKIAGIVKKVYAVDVSIIITDSCPISACELIISDGCRIPLPNDSIDVVYSNQLMEHLHPDDALAQLKDIYRVLRPKGHYVCITPNLVNGPWDISYYFDDVAKGFHLKEYSINELAGLFRRAGFERCEAYAGARGLYWRFPVHLIVLLEKMLLLFPVGFRVKLGRSLPFRMILGIKLVGIKQ